MNKAKTLLKELELELEKLELVAQTRAQYEQERPELLAKIGTLTKSVESRFKELATLTQMLEATESRASQLEQVLEQREQRVARLHFELTSARLADYRALILDSGLFDGDWYLEMYPDVKGAGMDPLDHYLLHGVIEGRTPCSQFDANWYVIEYPDAQDSVDPPLVHYLTVGKDEGYLPQAADATPA